MGMPIRSRKIAVTLLVTIFGAACGVYHDDPIPSPVAGVSGASTAKALSPKSDSNGIITASLPLATEPLRLTASTGSASKGAEVEFSSNGFVKAIDVTMESLGDLPVKELAVEAGTESVVTSVGSGIYLGASQAIDAVVPFTVRLPLPTAPAVDPSTLSVLAVVTSQVSGDTSVMLLAPKDFKIDGGRVVFQSTAFGLYSLVTAKPAVTVRIKKKSSRSPEKYRLSKSGPMVRLSDLPKKVTATTTATATSTDRDAARLAIAALPQSVDTTLNVNVAGKSIANYKYALLSENLDCSSATYSSLIPVATNIKDSLGTNGIKTLCVKGQTTSAKETDVETYTWKKVSATASLAADGASSFTLTNGGSATVTLKLASGSEVTNLTIGDFALGFGYLGGSFPGTGGTCRAASMSRSCTIVLTFSGASGKYSNVAHLSYFDGTVNQYLPLTLTATVP